MARHTNKRRNTRKRRQTRGKRRRQRGGGLFSSTDDDIKELQGKIDKSNENIPKWKEEIVELQNKKNDPEQSIFSKFFGSKENSSPEQEKVAYKEGKEGKEGESVVPKSVVVPEGANEYNKSNNFSGNTQREPQYGPMPSEYRTQNQSAGSRRRRRHRSHRRHRRK